MANDGTMDFSGPEVNGRNRRIISLLGPPQTPTDGVLDHAHLLSEALVNHGHRASVIHHRWDREGWTKSLRALPGRLLGADHVIMHYTHLAWSRRGFPIRALLVATLIRRRRLWLLIHDPVGFPYSSLIGRVRSKAQVLVMWMLVRFADRTYVTIHPSCVTWARKKRSSLRLLPVGSNVGASPLDVPRAEPSRPFTVVVFSITEGRLEEVRHVSEVMTLAAGTLRKEVRLLTFGSGVDWARRPLEQHLGSSVELVTEGVVAASEVGTVMRGADAQLFVRGSASSRRGTLVAGIAHRVPIVAFSGPETCWPVTEAGVSLVPLGDVKAAASALVRVATDPGWANQLRGRSEVAYQRWFVWERIAAGLIEGGLRG